jgi:hypothetical protein
MPVLLGMHLLFDYLGYARYPGRPHFLVISVTQLVMMFAVVAVLFVALRPPENNPLSGWDGAPRSPRSGGAPQSACCCAWRGWRLWLRSGGVSKATDSSVSPRW